MLGHVTLTVEEFVDNICCFILLEERDLDDILTQFLRDRALIPDYNPNFSTTEQINMVRDPLSRDFTLVKHLVLS